MFKEDLKQMKLNEPGRLWTILSIGDIISALTCSILPQRSCSNKSVLINPPPPTSPPLRSVWQVRIHVSTCLNKNHCLLYIMTHVSRSPSTVCHWWALGHHGRQSAGIHTHMQAQKHACLCARMHTYTHTLMCTHTHTHTPVSEGVLFTLNVMLPQWLGNSAEYSSHLVWG